MNDISSNEGATPLAQGYAVIFEAPEPQIYTDTPSLMRLPSGRLLSSFALLDRNHSEPGVPNREIKTLFHISENQGKTWKVQGSLELDDGIPFICRDRLYYLCKKLGRRDIVLVYSEDEAKTWSEPVTLFEGRFWNTFTPHAVCGNTLYWTLGAPNEEGNFNRAGSRAVVVAGDLKSNLMDPASWRISPYLTYPGTPEGLSADLFPFRDENPDGGDHWLEPNIVNVNGRIRVIIRLRIDGMATSHMCAVCDVDDQKDTLNFRFTQFYPLPGGQNYFHITRDDKTGYFWMTACLPTKSQDIEWGRKLNAMGFLGGPGNERRFLFLYYSLDALNWFPAGCVAMWPSPLQSFNYASLLINGDDLLIASRTSKNRPNQHDNDLVTFHRLPDFRSLTFNLHPEGI